MSLTLLALVFVSLLGGGIVKGAAGLGLPMIAIPVLSIFIGIPQAVTIVALPMFATNAWQIWQFRQERSNAGFLPSFLTAGALGILPGTWLLSSISAEYLDLALGITVVVYLLLRLSAPEFKLSEAQTRKIAPVAGFSAGLLQGATGLSGLVGATFFHAGRLSRGAFMFCLASMFFLFICIQLSLLVATGMATRANLGAGVFALIPAALGLYAGNAIAGRLERRVFDMLIYVVLSGSAIPLIWRSLALLF
ncbi:sulfite exporter TauE/SafE family protein [Aquamicrobium sp. LC103]|uniref:sulfite exporter TauE/SafE family protein n=1 Tax=Aquamicrobium sp. LC103 TaxID=1120658 RepID=UPI00063E88B7|nr:sulfite exporter TauE/SafE family protein [Aquamicrobium sp. LC103]TKT78158.1 sulfite exporter TauE/SafE family protein [Aquamicrobium sp. LC103]